MTWFEVRRIKCTCYVKPVCFSLQMKRQIEVSSSITLSMFMSKSTFSLCTVWTSQLLGGGHKTPKRKGLSYWLNREAVTGRGRKAKRMSSVFSGDRAESVQGKGLSQLFPAQCGWKKDTQRIKSRHSLPSSILGCAT